MSQNHVHLLLDETLTPGIPFVLDIQRRLLTAMGTRVVAPVIARRRLASAVVERLNPCIWIDGVEHVVVMQQLFAIDSHALGRSVMDLGAQSHTIVAALDTLISGI
jgi:hypothetical protein